MTAIFVPRQLTQLTDSAGTALPDVLSCQMSFIIGVVVNTLPAPDWASGTSYVRGNLVTDVGIIYRCILAVSGSTHPASDGSHWTADPIPLENLTIYGNGGLALDPAGTAPVDTTLGPWYYGKHNTYIGGDAGLIDVTGYFNTFVGSETGKNNVNGDQNTFVGGWAGRDNTSGYHNTFVGTGAGQTNTTGFFNIFIGCDTGLGATPGNYNTVVGTSAGQGMTADAGQNSLFGAQAGNGITSGDFNIVIGVSAGGAIGQNNANIMIGCGAGQTWVGASNNLIGHYSGRYAVGGSYNDALGGSTLQQNNSGDGNVAIGYQTLFYNTIGDYNICIGYRCAMNSTGLTSNDYCVYIGASIAPAASYSNAIAIGYGAVPVGSNTVIIGNASITATYLYGNVYPATDNTCYIGKNDDDTPLAWKGIILKDQGGTGKYYRIEVYDNALRIVDLTD